MVFIPCYKLLIMQVIIELEELKRLQQIEKDYKEGNKPFYQVMKMDKSIHTFYWDSKNDIERAYFERYGKLIDEM